MLITRNRHYEHTEYQASNIRHCMSLVLIDETNEQEQSSEQHKPMSTVGSEKYLRFKVYSSQSVSVYP